MTILQETLSGLVVGKPQVHRNLAAYPLFPDPTANGNGMAAIDYLTLDEALERGGIEISEVSDGGSVPHANVVNRLGKPVLLVDGQELSGAKQNRIVNLSILVPANSELTIPVTCVEQGRWGRRRGSEHFDAAPRVHFPSGRASKMRQVNESMRRSGQRRADQGQVWDELRIKAARMDSRSSTEAMGDMYERHRDNLEDFTKSVRPLEHQVGVCFAIGGRIVGLELFDRPDVLARYLPKIVRGVALDAVDAHRRRPDHHGDGRRSAVVRFLERLTDSPVEVYPAIGLGEDVRLGEGGSVGAALAFAKVPVHLCAFTS